MNETIIRSSISDLLRAARRLSFLNHRFIIPSICVVGVVANLTCCVIFLLPKFRLKIYHLLFWKSFFHLACNLIASFSPVAVVWEPIGWTYSTMVYRWAFRTWIYNACCMTALLCNLAVSFDRFIMISKKCSCFCSRIPVLALVAGFLLFSLACFCFPLFAYYISPVDPAWYPAHYFALYYTEWGNSIQFLDVRVAMFCIRDIVLWLLFVVVNCVLLYEAKKVFRRKARLTSAVAVVAAVNTNISAPVTTTVTVNSSSSVKKPKSNSPVVKSQSARAERRMTYMIVVMSAVLAFGQMPFFINIAYRLYITYNPDNAVNGLEMMFNQLAFITLDFSFSVSAIIYYFFDKNFKATINNLVKRILRRPTN